jgi:integrase
MGKNRHCTEPPNADTRRIDEARDLAAVVVTTRPAAPALAGGMPAPCWASTTSRFASNHLRNPTHTDDPVLGRHLRHLKLRGRVDAYIYARRRILTRLAETAGKPLLDITTDDLATWRETLRLTPDAIVYTVSHVKEFYRWAVQEDLIEASPAERIPSPRRVSRLRRPIAEADLMIALRAASPRIRLMLILAAWAGLRAQEIAYLRRESVMEQADPAVILITWHTGKGRRERIVPLAPFVVAELAAAGLPRSGYVFPRPDRLAGPVQPWNVSQTCNGFLHDHGITATLHQLRHRFGTMTYRASHDLLAVQQLLGHTSPTTTAIYAAYDNSSAIAAVTALPIPPAQP